VCIFESIPIFYTKSNFVLKSVLKKEGDLIFPVFTLEGSGQLIKHNYNIFFREHGYSTEFLAGVNNIFRETSFIDDSSVYSGGGNEKAFLSITPQEEVFLWGKIESCSGIFYKPSSSSGGGCLHVYFGGFLTPRGHSGGKYRCGLDSIEVKRTVSSINTYVTTCGITQNQLYKTKNKLLVKQHK